MGKDRNSVYVGVRQTAFSQTTNVKLSRREENLHERGLTLTLIFKQMKARLTQTDFFRTAAHRPEGFCNSSSQQSVLSELHLDSRAQQLSLSSLEKPHLKLEICETTQTSQTSTVWYRLCSHMEIRLCCKSVFF